MGSMLMIRPSSIGDCFGDKHDGDATFYGGNRDIESGVRLALCVRIYGHMSMYPRPQRNCIWLVLEADVGAGSAEGR